jgi:hypothetical protein
MLRVWLKDKVVGHTKLDKIQRMISLFYAILRVMNYSLNIYSAKTVVILCCVELSY